MAHQEYGVMNLFTEVSNLVKKRAALDSAN